MYYKEYSYTSTEPKDLCGLKKGDRLTILTPNTHCFSLPHSPAGHDSGEERMEIDAWFMTLTVP